MAVLLRLAGPSLAWAEPQADQALLCVTWASLQQLVTCQQPEAHLQLGALQQQEQGCLLQQQELVVWPFCWFELAFGQPTSAWWICCLLTVLPLLQHCCSLALSRGLKPLLLGPALLQALQAALRQPSAGFCVCPTGAEQVARPPLYLAGVAWL